MSGIIMNSPNMKSGIIGRYPDGHIFYKKIWKLLNFNGASSHTNDGSAQKAIDDSYSFEVIAGNTYFIEVSIRAYTAYSGPSATMPRRGYIKIFYGVNHSQDDTSFGSDTYLQETMFGNYLIANSTADAHTFSNNATVRAAIVATTNKTEYFTVVSAVDTPNINIVCDFGGVPNILQVTGLQGDITTATD